MACNTLKKHSNIPTTEHNKKMHNKPGWQNPKKLNIFDAKPLALEDHQPGDEDAFNQLDDDSNTNTMMIPSHTVPGWLMKIV